MVGMGQGGLGLPDRDYYLVDTPKFADIRAKYVTHIAAMFRLAGYADAEARAKAVFALEHDIARAHWTQVENRDPVKTYNLRSPAALATEAPGVDWPAFLAAAGVARETRLDVNQPSAFAGMAKLVADRPLAVWQDYLALRTLKAHAWPTCPRRSIAENFAFDGTVLNGGSPSRSRGGSAASTTVDGAMGEAVGKLYVAKYFTPEAKAKIDALVHNLLASMGAADRRGEPGCRRRPRPRRAPSWRRSIPRSAIRRSGAIIRSSSSSPAMRSAMPSAPMRSSTTATSPSSDGRSTGPSGA